MSFAYMRFYTGDYYRDTRHLSMLQHGAYRQLLDHCWDQKGPLPLDVEKCYRICGAVSKEEQECVRSIVGEFFVKMEDGHYNRRMQLEIESSEAIAGARSDAGKKGAAARAKQLPSKSRAIAKQLPLSPSPSPSLSQEVPKKEKASRKRSPFDASQISLPDWLPVELWGKWVADRKERKKPISEAAASLQVSKLAKYMADGHAPRDVIEHSIAGGYQGLFPPAKGKATVDPMQGAK